MALDYAALSDEQLVVLLARCDVEALGALYDRHARYVLGMAMAVLRDQPAAEETLQDVFLKLWRQPESFDAGRGRFANWLLSVTRNRAIDVLRARRPTISTGDPDVANLLLAVASDAPDPAEEAVLAEQRRQVRRALRDLPAAQRQVVELAYFGGLSQSEIARYLNEPLGTVKTRVRLAMQKLRTSLAEIESWSTTET
jgi:RNA polymerase sigma-70 factor (ECF subfamily)